MTLTSNLCLQTRLPTGEVRTQILDAQSLAFGMGVAGKIKVQRENQGRFWVQNQMPEDPIKIQDLEVQAGEWPIGTLLLHGDAEYQIIRQRSDSSLARFSQFPWKTQSTQGLELLRQTESAARTQLPVYLQGETGTGKEILARVLHDRSAQAKGPFTPLNCGGLPESLVDSELFGHVRGAFTGASQNRAGALLKSHHGTLFLDEMGDLPLTIQAKLLRFLESGEIRPLGSDQLVFSKVRIVCATHHPLKRLVSEGRFREDLYYRIASITLQVPPLRERPQDIRLLAQNYCQEEGKTLTHAACLYLQSHSWPGNVRQLRHAILRASAQCPMDRNFIHKADFSFLAEKDTDLEGLRPSMEGINQINEMEKQLLIRALKITQGNRTAAAKVLGVARSTVFEMLKRHQLKMPAQRGFSSAYH